MLQFLQNQKDPKQSVVDSYGVTRDVAGFSKMEKAAAKGTIETVRDCINQDPNAVKKEELAHPLYGQTRTALYLAAQNGSARIVDLLLDHGAHPGFMDDGLLTPLSAAVVKGRSGVVKTMLARKNPTIQQFDPKGLALSHAFQANQPYIAFLLYQKGFRLISDNDNAYLEFELFSLLETHLGETINQNQIENALSLYGHLHARTNRYGHHVNRSKPYSELDIAVIKGDLIAAKRLLSKLNITQINRPGFLGLTALHWAALKGDSIMVELLLQKGADPDLRSDHHLTALHLSVLHDSDDIYQSIAKFSRNLNPRTTNKQLTPLHLAILEENGLVIKAMRNNPLVNFNAKMQNNLTPKALADQRGIVFDMPTSDASSPTESASIDKLTDLIADLELGHKDYQYQAYCEGADFSQIASQTYLIRQAANGGVQEQMQVADQQQNSRNYKTSKL